VGTQTEVVPAPRRQQALVKGRLDQPFQKGRSPQNGTVISGGCQIKVTSF